jgi:Protein of unknown function (DUF4230)
MEYIIILLAGLAIGAILVYFLIVKKIGKSSSTAVNSTLIVEKIERVFKVVLAEGYFSEVYDYKHSDKFLYIIPQTKKALIIINAKVLMGYDFKKFKYEIDADSNKLKIIEFPPCEILSVDPNVKYYNVEENMFNKFSTEDLTQMQAEAKNKIVEKVGTSDLPAIAAQQMQQLLTEVASIGQWQLLGIEKVKQLKA